MQQCDKETSEGRNEDVNKVVREWKEEKKKEQTGKGSEEEWK
jgi:hypothetical protein